MDNKINEMIERVLIQRNKTVDDMILGEIRKIATENGIDTIITLNDKAIIQALKNFVEVVRCEKCKYGDVSIHSLSKDGEETIACYCNLKKAVTDVDYYCPSGERK